MARALIVLVIALACVAQALAQASLCKKGAQPATPRNVRVFSQKYNPSNKKVGECRGGSECMTSMHGHKLITLFSAAEVTIAFDNPTNANTGCPQAYT
jgi:hypothetical protein